MLLILAAVGVAGTRGQAFTYLSVKAGTVTFFKLAALAVTEWK